MSTAFPINAHQQIAPGAPPLARSSACLLRRPRPPKVTSPASAATTKDTTSRVGSSPRGNGSLGEAPSRTRRRNPPPHSTYPHPTPLTPYSLYASTAPSRSQYDEYPETYGSKNSVTIHSLYPRGPPFLPPGKILKASHPPLSVVYKEHPELEPSGVIEKGEVESEFTLTDFRAAVGVLHRVEASQLQGAMISRQNYLKLTSWFSTHVPKQGALNTVDIKGTLHNITEYCGISKVDHEIS